MLLLTLLSEPALVEQYSIVYKLFYICICFSLEIIYHWNVNTILFAFTFVTKRTFPSNNTSSIELASHEVTCSASFTGTTAYPSTFYPVSPIRCILSGQIIYYTYIHIKENYMLL